MARRPACLERAGALTPRDRIWSALRALGAGSRAERPTFSAAEVALLSGERCDTALSYLQGLEAAGYVAVVEPSRPAARPRREFALRQLLRDVGVDAPRVTREGKPVTAGLANERMWAAIKALREFDPAELCAAAQGPDAPVSVETANTYVKMLARAGYVALSAPARTGRSMARYRFNRARNTGPRAPMICRDKSVMDGNTGEVVYRPGGAR